MKDIIHEIIIGIICLAGAIICLIDLSGCIQHIVTVKEYDPNGNLKKTFHAGQTNFCFINATELLDIEYENILYFRVGHMLNKPDPNSIEAVGSGAGEIAEGIVRGMGGM